MADHDAAAPAVEEPVETGVEEEEEEESENDEDPLINAEPADDIDAVRIVVTKASEHRGVKRGLSETVRALDKKTAHLCVIAEDCDEPRYVRLIKALCHQNAIPIIEGVDRETIGKWAGLSRYNKENNLKKIIKCSSIAVVDFGERTRALDYLQEKIA